MSSVFTQSGEGFYLGAPSEFVRFSVSARTITKPRCCVEVKDGVRVELAPLPEPAKEGETPAEGAEAAHEQPAGEAPAAAEAEPAAAAAATAVVASAG